MIVFWDKDVVGLCAALVQTTLTSGGSGEEVGSGQVSITSQNLPHSQFFSIKSFFFPPTSASCWLWLWFLGWQAGFGLTPSAFTSQPFQESTIPVVVLEPTALGLKPLEKPAHGAHQPKNLHYLFVLEGVGRKWGSSILQIPHLAFLVIHYTGISKARLSFTTAQALQGETLGNKR